MPISWACVEGLKCVESDSSICDMAHMESPCTENEFQCHLEEIIEKQCVSSMKVCDNVTDCSGGEDEAYCSGINFIKHQYVKNCCYSFDQEYKYFSILLS